MRPNVINIGIKKILCVCLCLGIIGMPAFAQKGFDEFEGAAPYKKLLKSKEYKKALTAIKAIPEKKLSLKEKKLILHLESFDEVNKAPKPKGILATSDEDVGPEIAKKAKKLYRQSQELILDEKQDIARDVLIYILYIYPDNHQAKMLLEINMELKPEDYKVYDVVKKYMSRSETYFYGGSYLLAKQDLEVLSIIERDNPVVFERLGSTYYLMNQKKKAIDAWTMALFVDPSNSDLEALVKKTKKAMQDEAKQKLVKKKTKKVKKVQIKDAQIMGVFASQSQAFELMKTLKQKGLKVLIEETDNGRWAVKVSRSELMKKNKK